MGNVTDTMKRSFKSFLRLGVALVVLGALSTGAALGQAFTVQGTGNTYSSNNFQGALDDPNCPNCTIIVNDTDVDLNDGQGVSEYTTRFFDDNTIQTYTIRRPGSGAPATVTLDQDLRLGDNELILSGGGNGGGVNLEFPGNNKSLIVDTDDGPQPNVGATSFTPGNANRIVFSGEGEIRDVTEFNTASSSTDPAAPTGGDVGIERLEIAANASVTFVDNNDPSVSGTDRLFVQSNGGTPENGILEVEEDGKLDMGGNRLFYGIPGDPGGALTATFVDVDGANDLTLGGRVTNGQRFSIALENTGSSSTYTIEGSGDLEVPVTYVTSGSPNQISRVIFEQTAIGQFGFSRFGQDNNGNARNVNDVDLPFLEKVRASLLIDGNGGMNAVEFGDPEPDPNTSSPDAATTLSIESTFRIQNGSSSIPVVETAPDLALTVEGRFEMTGSNTVANFPTDDVGVSDGNPPSSTTPASTPYSPTERVADAADTPLTLNGRVDLDGGTLHLRAPGPADTRVKSEINGTLNLNGGTLSLEDLTRFTETSSGTILGEGLHNVAINGDANFSTDDIADAGNTQPIQSDPDDEDLAPLDEPTVFFEGDSQALTVDSGTDIEIERMVTNFNSANLTNAGSGEALDIIERITLKDGIFTTNGNLNAPFAELLRIKDGDGHGQLRSGPNSSIAYIGTLGDPNGDGSSDVNSPSRVEYRGTRNISTGDELIGPSEPAVDRTVPNFVVDMDASVDPRPVVTLNPDYEVTATLQILGGNLSLGSASLSLANGVAFVRGDGTLDPGPVPPAQALQFPDVAGTNLTPGNSGVGINLVYVNDIDVEVGIEWPEKSRSANAADVINNVIVHTGLLLSAFDGDGAVSLPGGDDNTYRFNGDYIHAAGTFDYNSQTLEANAQRTPGAAGPGVNVFAILDETEQETASSNLRLVGSDNHVVAGINLTDDAKAYGLPATTIDKEDTPLTETPNSGSADATVLYAVVYNGPNGRSAAGDNGFAINGDFTVDSAGDRLDIGEGFFALNHEFFQVQNNFTQNTSNGLFAVDKRIEVTEGNFTKATDDSSTVFIGAAGNQIEVGGDLTHTGATDSLITNNISAEGGLLFWTLGNAGTFSSTDNTSRIDIGGDVMQDGGYASLATTFPANTSATEQVNIGGDAQVNGGQFFLDNPLSGVLGGPLASELATVGGEINVTDANLTTNLAALGSGPRVETLEANALTIGTDAQAQSTAKSGHLSGVTSRHFSGIEANSQFPSDTYSEGDGLIDRVSPRREDPNDDPNDKCTEKGDEECEVLGLTVDGPDGLSATEPTLDDPSDPQQEGEVVELDAKLSQFSSALGDQMSNLRTEVEFTGETTGSAIATKSDHEGDFDTIDIASDASVEEDGRLFLDGNGLEVGGDFEFLGFGDIDTTNPDATNAGLAGLVRLDGDDEQSVDVGDTPNQYLHGVAVDGAGITLENTLTLSTASTANTSNDHFERDFGTLFLENGNVVTGEDSLIVTEPTPTSGDDLIEANSADDNTGTPGTSTPSSESPVLGGSRNSHIIGTLSRALDETTPNTGGFVEDGYIYPMGDGEEYRAVVVEPATDFGDEQFFTVDLVEDPEIDLPADLTSDGVDERTGEDIELNLNVTSEPFFGVNPDGVPDENVNVRIIAGGVGPAIDRIKQMRIVQYDTTASTVQEAGRYDVTGDPADDYPFGPNSFISGVPNVQHEGVDFREGNVIGLASDSDYNALGNESPFFAGTNQPEDQSVNVGETAEVTFTVQDPNTDPADLNFSTSGDVNVSSSSQSGNEFTVTIEPDSADAEASFVDGGTDNELDLIVEATDSEGNSGSASIGVTVGLQNGDANSSGTVNTADASVALDAFLENVSLTPVQTDAADQNDDGSVTPFDAAEILQIALGGSSAQVAKADDASAGTVVIGDADRSDGTITLPVELTGNAENVRSVAVEVTLDGASQQEVKNVATNLPSGWIADHKSSADGTLKIGMAGPSALSAGEIATIQLQGADDPADETSGTFRLNGSDAQDLEVQVSPESFALNGNYPNPFSTATTISYDLKEAANVSIEVYDILGRKVGTLVNKKQSAGSYEVTLNRGSGLGAQMSSGVYVYRIKAGDFTASEKMTVVR
jgi:hypothetical protein